jgi:hypothetical protein
MSVFPAGFVGVPEAVSTTRMAEYELAASGAPALHEPILAANPGRFVIFPIRHPAGASG